MRKSPNTDHICSERELSNGLKVSTRPKKSDAGPLETAGAAVAAGWPGSDVRSKLTAWDLDKKDRAQREATRKIKASIAYMMQHPDKPLQVSALSAMAGVSPSHYFVLFKCVTGFAPIDFFIRVRMQRACELLEETNSSVKQVAALLGYTDPFYFSRLFKSVNGVAPSVYRVMLAESGEGERSAALAHSEKETSERFSSPPPLVPKKTGTAARTGDFSIKPDGNFPSRHECILS